MLLIYIDESGINYQKTNNFYVDGPYMFWSGILIPENKYFHLERLYCELTTKYLKIKDWCLIEAHATYIWARKGQFQNLSESIIKEYFEELIQLLVKLDIKIVFGLQLKMAKNKQEKLKERNKCIYSLLHALEYKLSQLNETGIIIADEGDDTIDNLLFEKTQWRFNPFARKPRKQRSRFKFEAQSCFLLDRVHFIDSKKSMFLQIADQVAFVIQRIFTYSYLFHVKPPGVVADKSKVPITVDTFLLSAGNIYMSEFKNDKNDVQFTEIKDIAINHEYLKNIFQQRA